MHKTGTFYFALTDLNIDLVELQKKLEQLQPGKGPQDPKPLIQELLETILPGFERDLREMQKDLQARPAALLAAQASVPVPAVAQAIMAGVQKYTYPGPYSCHLRAPTRFRAGNRK